MSLTVTLVPGFVFSSGNPGEELTYPNLNLLGSPTITLAGTIDSSQLGDGAVTTLKIADDAVTGAKIADDSIGLQHLVHQSAGSLFSFDGSGIPTTIPIGPAGYILTSDGSQASWQSSASFSIYPGDLSNTLDRNTLDRLDEIIVGDVSAGTAKRMDLSELIEVDTYVQRCTAFDEAEIVVCAFGSTPDHRDNRLNPVTLGTVTSAIGTTSRAQNIVTFAPYAGELVRITICNQDASNQLSATVDLVKLDPVDPFGGTVNNESIGTHSVTTLAVGGSDSIDITADNTFAAGDPLVVWYQRSAGGRMCAILTYRLSR